MEFYVTCSCGDVNSLDSMTVEVNSIDELITEIEGFFEDEGGIEKVKSFFVEPCSDEDKGRCPGGYEWDINEVKKHQTLEDVWKGECQGIKNWFGELFIKGGNDNG